MADAVGAAVAHVVGPAVATAVTGAFQEKAARQRLESARVDPVHTPSSSRSRISRMRDDDRPAGRVAGAAGLAAGGRDSVAAATAELIAQLSESAPLQVEQEWEARRQQ